ncbi:MOSC domain-containing protein [Acinetobacter baumannii]
MCVLQGSLNAFNAHLKEPVSVNRFRPNIVVDGCEPFSEDLWKEIRINNLTFQGVKLCSRCKVPSINQETAEAGSEVAEILQKYRSDKVLRPNRKQQQGKVFWSEYGVYRVPSRRTGQDHKSGRSYISPQNCVICC